MILTPSICCPVRRAAARFPARTILQVRWSGFLAADGQTRPDSRLGRPIAGEGDLLTLSAVPGGGGARLLILLPVISVVSVESSGRSGEWARQRGAAARTWESNAPRR
jgi:hypothetical protein